jgi:anti-sigma-K factor RskA
MIDERAEAQASLYALGALGQEEVAEFEAQLRRSLELQLLVQELRASVDLMTLDFPRQTAPLELKNRILAAISETKVQPIVVPRKSWFANWVETNLLPWSLAGSFALLCLFLFWIGAGLRRQASELARQLDETEKAYADLQKQTSPGTVSPSATRPGVTNSDPQIAELRKQIDHANQELARQRADYARQMQKRTDESTKARELADATERRLSDANRELERLQTLVANGVPSGVPLSQLNVRILNPTTDGPPSATGVSVWDPVNQKGILLLQNLSQAPQNRDYQLWVFDSKTGAPVSAGVLPPGNANLPVEFTTALQVASADKFAISLERKGGAPSPQGKVLMVSN